MKKKFLCILFFLVALVCFGVGCKEAVQTPPVYEVYGFTVEEQVDVEYGESYTITRPYVYDSYGNTIDVAFTVKDSSGNVVQTAMQGFFVVDGGGYTIVFTAKDYQEQTHTRETKINVLNARDLGISSKKVYDKGELVEITPVCIFTNPTYEYSVSLNGTVITPEYTQTSASFTATNNGVYDVTVKATSGGRTAEYAYEVLVREPMKTGEVERFDADWAKARELSGFGLYNGVVTTTEASGVKDRFNEDGQFLSVTVGANDVYGEARMYLNPRAELTYYETLAAEGYDTMSVWLYTEAENVNVYKYKDGNLVGGRSKACTLRSGVWTEVKFPVLNTPSNAWAGNLQDHYENWKTQLASLLRAKSADKTAPITVYVDDIFVTKSAAVTGQSKAVTGYKTGDEVKVDDFFSYVKTDYTLSYLITDEYGLTESVGAPDSYRFTHNGAFTVSARVKGDNYTTTATATFDVSDEVTLQKTNAIVKRTTANQSLTVPELFGKMQYNATKYDVRLLKASYLKKEAVVTANNGFVSDRDGYYACLIAADYPAFGTTCTSYKEVIVDIYSEETKYDFIENSVDCLAMGIFHTQKVADEATKEALGLTGDFYEVKASQGGTDRIGWARLGLNLLHSQEYYKQVLAKEDWTVSYDVYLKPDGIDDDSVKYNIRFASETSTTQYTSNTLITKKYALEELFHSEFELTNKLFLITKSTGADGKVHYAYIGNIRFEKVEKIETEKSQNDFFENK